MRKSLREIQHIEKYILGQMSTQECHNFNVQLLLNPQLRNEVDIQKSAYTFINSYGRQKLKAELNIVHEKLFSHPEKKWFRRLIKNIFNQKR